MRIGRPFIRKSNTRCCSCSQQCAFLDRNVQMQPWEDVASPPQAQWQNILDLEISKDRIVEEVLKRTEMQLLHFDLLWLLRYTHDREMATSTG